MSDSLKRISEDNDERHDRLQAMKLRLQQTPLSAFTADYAFALCIVVEPRGFESMFRDSRIDEALTKLEAFFVRYDAEARNVDPRYAEGHAPGSRLVKKPRQFRRKRPNV